MTEEEIKQAEQELKNAEAMLKNLLEWQSDWEKVGVDRSQIDSSAKADIGIIGEEAWLKIRREKLEEFQKEYNEAKEMLEKAKQKLKQET